MTMTASLGPGNNAANNANNMYRVGDYVYFETSAAGAYAIRRIEELNKTASGK
jgi:metastasis-associated protein MTA